MELSNVRLKLVALINNATSVATGGVSNTGDGPSTIRLDDGVALPSIALGDRIAERGEFEVTISNVALAEEDEGAANIKITATSVT